MTISKMRKITFLSDKDYLDDVILSLQSYQAIELTPPKVASQNKLVNAYYAEQVNDFGTRDTIPDEIFESKTYKNEVTHYSNLLEDVSENIAFIEELLPKTGFFDNLNQEKETMTLEELNDRVNAKDLPDLVKKAKKIKQTVNSLKKKRKTLKEEQNFFKRWRALDFNPKETENFALTRVIVGAVDQERDKTFNETVNSFHNLYLERLHYSEEETQYLIIVSQDEFQELEKVLTSQRFESLEYPYDDLPQAELEKNKTKLAEVNEQLGHLDDEPEEIVDLLEKLKLSEEYLFNLRERIQAKEDILQSDHLFILSGWIEEDMVEQQVEAIKRSIGSEHAFLDIDEVEGDEQADVPIKFKNRPSTSAFEGTVEMYSTPRYDELDPTPFVQPFSILFFGMMTVDAGYGLLGLLATTLALKFMDLSASMEKNLKFFRQLMIGTTLAGLFFGSFFGFDLPFGVMSLTDQLIEVMGIAIAIGLVHLVLGLFLNTINKNRKGQYAESYISGYSWILILVGAAVLAVNMLLSGPAFWNTIGLALIIVNLIGIVVISVISSKSKAAGLGQGLFGLMDITSYIGDVISYTRLAALGVAGANIGMAFNLIIGMLPPVFRFTIGILIFLALHLFNMMISMISAYVHTLRLNYVEFFGKFYEGGGETFEPIPLLQKNIQIKTQNLK